MPIGILSCGGCHNGRRSRAVTKSPASSAGGDCGDPVNPAVERTDPAPCATPTDTSINTADLHDSSLNTPGLQGQAGSSSMRTGTSLGPTGTEQQHDHLPDPAARQAGSTQIGPDSAPLASALLGLEIRPVCSASAGGSSEAGSSSGSGTGSVLGSSPSSCGPCPLAAATGSGSGSSSANTSLGGSSGSGRVSGCGSGSGGGSGHHSSCEECVEPRTSVRHLTIVFGVQGPGKQDVQSVEADAVCATGEGEEGQAPTADDELPLPEGCLSPTLVPSSPSPASAGSMGYGAARRAGRSRSGLPMSMLLVTAGQEAAGAGSKPAGLGMGASCDLGRSGAGTGTVPAGQRQSGKAGTPSSIPRCATTTVTARSAVVTPEQQQTPLGRSSTLSRIPRPPDQGLHRSAQHSPATPLTNGARSPTLNTASSSKLPTAASTPAPAVALSTTARPRTRTATGTSGRLPSGHLTPTAFTCALHASPALGGPSGEPPPRHSGSKLPRPPVATPSPPFATRRSVHIVGASCATAAASGASTAPQRPPFNPYGRYSAKPIAPLSAEPLQPEPTDMRRSHTFDHRSSIGHPMPRLPGAGDRAAAGKAPLPPWRWSTTGPLSHLEVMPLGPSCDQPPAARHAGAAAAARPPAGNVRSAVARWSAAAAAATTAGGQRGNSGGMSSVRSSLGSVSLMGRASGVGERTRVGRAASAAGSGVATPRQAAGAPRRGAVPLSPGTPTPPAVVCASPAGLLARGAGSGAWGRAARYSACGSEWSVDAGPAGLGGMMGQPGDRQEHEHDVAGADFPAASSPRLSVDGLLLQGSPLGGVGATVSSVRPSALPCPLLSPRDDVVPMASPNASAPGTARTAGQVSSPSSSLPPPAPASSPFGHQSSSRPEPRPRVRVPSLRGLGPFASSDPVHSPSDSAPGSPALGPGSRQLPEAGGSGSGDEGFGLPAWAWTSVASLLSGGRPPPSPHASTPHGTPVPPSAHTSAGEEPAAPPAPEPRQSPAFMGLDSSRFGSPSPLGRERRLQACLDQDPSLAPLRRMPSTPRRRALLAPRPPSVGSLTSASRAASPATTASPSTAGADAKSVAAVEEELPVPAQDGVGDAEGVVTAAAEGAAVMEPRAEGEQLQAEQEEPALMLLRWASLRQEDSDSPAGSAGAEGGVAGGEDTEVCSSAARAAVAAGGDGCEEPPADQGSGLEAEVSATELKGEAEGPATVAAAVSARAAGMEATATAAADGPVAPAGPQQAVGQGDLRSSLPVTVEDVVAAVAAALASIQADAEAEAAAEAGELPPAQADARSEGGSAALLSQGCDDVQLEAPLGSLFAPPPPPVAAAAENPVQPNLALPQSPAREVAPAGPLPPPPTPAGAFQFAVATAPLADTSPRLVPRAGPAAHTTNQPTGEDAPSPAPVPDGTQPSTARSLPAPVPTPISSAPQSSRRWQAPPLRSSRAFPSMQAHIQAQALTPRRTSTVTPPHASPIPTYSADMDTLGGAAAIWARAASFALAEAEPLHEQAIPEATQPPEAAAPDSAFAPAVGDADGDGALLSGRSSRATTAGGATGKVAAAVSRFMQLQRAASSSGARAGTAAAAAPEGHGGGGSTSRSLAVSTGGFVRARAYSWARASAAAAMVASPSATSGAASLRRLRSMAGGPEPAGGAGEAAPLVRRDLAAALEAEAGAEPGHRALLDVGQTPRDLCLIGSPFGKVGQEHVFREEEEVEEQEEDDGRQGVQGEEEEQDGGPVLRAGSCFGPQVHEHEQCPEGGTGGAAPQGARTQMAKLQRQLPASLSGPALGQPAPASPTRQLLLGAAAEQSPRAEAAARGRCLSHICPATAAAVVTRTGDRQKSGLGGRTPALASSAHRGALGATEGVSEAMAVTAGVAARAAQAEAGALEVLAQRVEVSVVAGEAAAVGVSGCAAMGDAVRALVKGRQQQLVAAGQDEGAVAALALRAGGAACAALEAAVLGRGQLVASCFAVEAKCAAEGVVSSVAGAAAVAGLVRRRDAELAAAAGSEGAAAAVAVRAQHGQCVALQAGAVRPAVAEAAAAAAVLELAAVAQARAVEAPAPEVERRGLQAEAEQAQSVGPVYEAVLGVTVALVLELAEGARSQRARRQREQEREQQLLRQQELLRAWLQQQEGQERLAAGSEGGGAGAAASVAGSRRSSSSTLQQAFGVEAGATADAALRLRAGGGGGGVLLGEGGAGDERAAAVGPASFMLLSAELGSGDWEVVEGGQGEAAVRGVGSFPLWGTSAFGSRSTSPPPQEHGEGVAMAAAWEAGVRLCSHPVGDWGCGSDQEDT